MAQKRHTDKHLYYPEPLDEEKELKFLVEPLISEYECTNPQRHNDETTSKCIVLFVKNSTPVLQNGPMCGLVAMTMASQLLDQETRPTIAHPECILEFAKRQGLTNKGEMFSTQYMQRVLQEHLKLNAEIVRIQSLSAIELIELLLSSSQAILVPYDADKNHTPCLAGGHKAHWCMLVGFAITLTVEKANQTLLLQCTQTFEGHFSLKSSSKDRFTEMLVSGQCVLDKVCVFARHGKSRHMGLWNWDDLVRSNENLLEIDPQRTEAGGYVLPTSGGIHEGLCNQIIVVSHA